MLPPDMPTMLRGRPKQMRRKEACEWGTQDKSQGKRKATEVPGFEKYRGGKVMHCSLCKQAGHKRYMFKKRWEYNWSNCWKCRKWKCKGEKWKGIGCKGGKWKGIRCKGSNERERAARKVETPQRQPDAVKTKSRPKLPVRRPTLPGVVVREQPTSQTTAAKPNNDAIKKQGKTCWIIKY